MDSVKSEKTKL